MSAGDQLQWADLTPSVAQGIEQAFLADDAYLKQFNLDGLEQKPVPVALYFPASEPGEVPNANLSFAIDGFPTLPGNPEVWLWMFCITETTRNSYREVSDY